MNKNDWHNIFSSLALLTQLGLIIIANIGVGFFLGRQLDRLFGLPLFFKMAGMILGVVSGFYSSYRLIRNFIGDNKDD